jgi:hypothetical protein
MMRPVGRLSVIFGVPAVLWVQPAVAQIRTCSPMSIQADPAVAARWPELPGQIRETFEGRDAIDRCARIELSMRDTSIVIEVVLPDGRAATRSVLRREDVVPTLEALLLVPERNASPRPPALEASESSVPSSGPQDISFEHPAPPPDVERDTVAQPSSRQPSRLRIELSAATGARIGDGQASVGLGVLAFLEISRWLVGFEGRADQYAALTRGASSGRTAVEFAVLGGRRFYFHSVAFDLAAGPALVPQGTASFAMQATSSAGPGVTASSSSIAPRLVVGPRVSFSPLSTVHTFIGIDGELGPARLGEGVPGAPRLPTWTVGLALGGTVGTR